MPLVKPFASCYARPVEGDYEYFLTDHLWQVACYWGKIDGNLTEKLYFLGGLCHDAAKARYEWQIKLTAPKRPVHSLPSAVIFSYYACRLLQKWNYPNASESIILKAIILKIIRDICDHHDVLRDIELECPWSGAPKRQLFFSDIDLDGLHQFIVHYFDEIADEPPPSDQQLRAWSKEFNRTWTKWQVSEMALFAERISMLKEINIKDGERFCCVRDKTASFILGDRLDAARIDTVILDKAMVQEAIANLECYCIRRGKELIDQDPKYRTMVEKRRQVQTNSLNYYQMYRGKFNYRFFALSLPTGLGKTLTSLRIALDSCQNDGYERIIYVAPYISILSQASKEIIEATDLEVLEHHHLSRLTEEVQEDKDSLLMESWQSPVVTTTFNQFFRALFPRRAQETMRLPAVRKAFIIIDEPQIIDSSVWNLFLNQLETLSEIYDCRVLFVSATLPPFHYGLSKLPVNIYSNVEVSPRYHVHYLPETIDEEGVAQQLNESTASSLCLVVNTVQDGCTIFDLLKKQIERKENYVEKVSSQFLEQKNILKAVLLVNLNGLMTPLHKEFIINFLKFRLSNKLQDRLILVSTQIVEAGVDLNFDEGYRNLAIMPSHIQFSGRINRHGGPKPGQVYIFNFMRQGNTDSRKWIYSSSIEREETDNLLKASSPISETECLHALENYYRKTFQRNTERALLNFIPETAKGKWSLLGGIEPFNGQYFTTPVFIPWPGRKELLIMKKFYHENKIDNTTVDRILTIMDSYGLYEVEEIYDMYQNREIINTFYINERKRFLALMQQFIVQAGNKLATGFAYQTGDLPIFKLIDLAHYSIDTGLAHNLGAEDKELVW